MTELEAVAKRWGSSLGIIIPKDVADKEHIMENGTVHVEIKGAHTARDVWGMLPKGWKKSTQQLKDEARKGWE